MPLPGGPTSSTRCRGSSECARSSAAYFNGQRQLSLPEFGSEEWFELAQKMFDLAGDNVFVISTISEAPSVLLTNNDLRNVPTETYTPPREYRRIARKACTFCTPLI